MGKFARVLLMSFVFVSDILAQDTNINLVLTQNYSKMRNALQAAGLDSEITSQNSVTVLALPDAVYPSTPLTADDLRLYVLLQYVDYSELQTITSAPNGTLNVATLFQSSGRAIGNGGSLLIREIKGGIYVTRVGDVAIPAPPPEIVGNVGQIPYSLSVLQLSAPLPRVKETYVALPPSPTPSPSQLSPEAYPLAPASGSITPAASSPLLPPTTAPVYSPESSASPALSPVAPQPSIWAPVFNAPSSSTPSPLSPSSSPLAYAPSPKKSPSHSPLKAPKAAPKRAPSPSPSPSSAPAPAPGPESSVPVAPTISSPAPSPAASPPTAAATATLAPILSTHLLILLLVSAATAHFL